MSIASRFVLDSKPIGQGGFATVFRAVDRETGGPVAIKQIRLRDEEANKRFRREMRLMEQCDHPHVVRILAHGESGDDLWYAMPLALGNLSDQMNRISRDESEIADVIYQVCSGLQYIHKLGIVHRDLNPNNVLHIRPGNWAISDFGLGKETERLTTTITLTGNWAGTPFYMAPEQFTDMKRVDHRADVYALGKVLQALVTNDLPQTTQDISGRFRQVVVRATSHDREDRHQAVEEFIQHFNDCLTEGTPLWRSASEILAANRERLNDNVPDEAAIRELMTIDFQFDEFSQFENNDILAILVTISRATVEAMWLKDPEWVRVFFRRFCSYISSRDFGFGFCDPLANFCLRICRVADDSQVTHVAIVSLLALGRRHNRWHVQGVVVALLQDARTQSEAATVLAALRSAEIDDVRWGLDKLAVGSLHPMLRENIPELLKGDEADIGDEELDDVPF